MSKIIDKITRYIMICFFALTYNVHARGTDQSSHKKCPLPKVTEDIIQCALIYHPSIKRELWKVESAHLLEEKITQLPNPTLSARYVRDSNDKDSSELEANIGFKIELGNKRNKRREYARANLKAAKALLDKKKAEVKITTVLKLYELKYLLNENQLILENILALEKIITKLEKLPRLSAQQEASLTLFKMALEDARINRSEIFDSQKEIEHYFHVSTGFSLDDLMLFLPRDLIQWPTINQDNEIGHSVSVDRMKSLKKVAESEFEIQKSHAWPDLKIGPSLGVEREDGLVNKKIGLNIQFDIPFFQVNSAGKAYANREVIRWQRNVSLVKEELNHERHEQFKIYKSAVNILKNTLRPKFVEKKHLNIETLYLRGVISSSILLNSYNQKMNYTKRRNKRELAALKALWNIYKFDGRIFEEKI